MESWNVAEVSRFFVEGSFDKEVATYQAVELFHCNRIRDKVLELLTDGDLQTIGLTTIEDKQLLNHLL